MTSATINNSINTEIRNVITWQYDNAPNLIQLVYMIGSMFTQSTAALWNNFIKKTNIADNGTTTEGTTTYEWDDYGLALWGKILNIPRPDALVDDDTTGHTRANLYRKIILARIKLLNGYYSTDASGNQTFNPANGSVDNYLNYVKSIFGNNVNVSDGNNMSLTFTKVTGHTMTEDEETLFDDYPDIAFAWPCGVRDNTASTAKVFGLDGQQNSVPTGFPTIGHLGECSFWWKRKILNPKGDGTYVWTDCEYIIPNTATLA